VTSSFAQPSRSVLGPTVSTQWLADHLGAENLVVLDATVLQAKNPDGTLRWQSGFEQYLTRRHIPGAIFADLISDFSDPDAELAFTRPTAAHFERAASLSGIDNETTVVVYDSSVGQWASRIWWLFRAFGYDRVAVLDGGFTKWTAEERLTEFDPGEPRPGASFQAHERPGLWAHKSDLDAIVDGAEDVTLVCGLPPAEFSGEAGPRPRLGHIPGSINAPAGRLVSRETNALLPLAQLEAIFADALASPAPIVTYCAAGIAAAADALALTLLGRDDVRLYDGSLNEWITDPASPVVALV
jgi:thiosulfate/3-mercaptopyruvate sulfurtransferase